MSFRFYEGKIFSYEIENTEADYKVVTQVLRDFSSAGNKAILFREERINNVDRQYFIDYNKSPFVFSEIPEDIANFGLFVLE